MTSVSKPRLYDLLPAYIRFRDQQLRGPEMDPLQRKEMGIAPLEALIHTLELPLHAIEANIDALYRGWFIETCEQWKIPYLGDLFAVQGLGAGSAELPSHRRLVANTIAYRRHKGTPAALGRVAEDLTGWDCHIRLSRDRTAFTHDLRSPRPARAGSADLKGGKVLDETGEVSTQHPQTLDLRQDPAKADAGSVLESLELELYRLESNPVSGGEAPPDAGDPGRRYRFHASGVDTRLFNQPQTPDGVVYETEAHHLPVPLDRRELAQEIAARRSGQTPVSRFLGSHPAFRIQVRESTEDPWREITPEKMEICDLADWSDPMPPPDWSRAEVAVDPETGRLLFPEYSPQRQVRVDYSYGSSDDLGGGPYPRDDHARSFGDAPWRAIVDRDLRSDLVDGVPRFKSLEQALNVWCGDASEKKRHAAIRIDDSGRHDIGDFELELSAEHHLILYAAERAWPQIVGRIAVRGKQGGLLELDGIGVQGGLTLEGDPSLTLRHCTVHPQEEDVAVNHGNGSSRGEVSIEHCMVTGPIHLPMTLDRLMISDSILDAGTGWAIRGVEGESGLPVGGWCIPGSGQETVEVPGPPTQIDRSTVFGRVSLLELRQAANTLFTELVTVLRPREGELFYCYFIKGSILPRAWECLEGPRTDGGGWLRPSFTSKTYGQPGYAQLTPCSGLIRYRGAQGQEIGVYHRLAQADRLVGLKAALADYLPAKSTYRIRFVT